MVRKLMAVSVLACGAWLVVPATSASAAPLCEQLSGTGVLLFVAPNQPACVPYSGASECDYGTTNVLDREMLYNEVCIPAP